MLGNTRAFNPYKELGALKAYFKLIKQFIVYLDRIAASRSYYFRNDREEGIYRLEDVIKLSDE